MDEKLFKRKERQRLLIVGTLCFVAIIAIIGYTYSYLEITATDSTSITGTVASASLSMEVNKLAPDIDKPLVPQLDTAIASAVVGTQGNCIDDNHNAVCQVYEVKVKNTSSIAIKVDGLLRLNAGNNVNLKWTLIDGYEDDMITKPNVTGDINKHQISTITANETYASQQEKTYYLVVWISETGSTQTDTGDFSGVITFKDSEIISDSSTTLYALGIAPNTETPSFDKTSCSSGCGENTVGVYSYQDDLGTSYYFRGDVENNYVRFANKYWRIIRINGDGTVRMIYDGTSAHTNGESSTNRYVTTRAFNSSADDNAYVGYMYGTISASSYSRTHFNMSDSTIKDYLENTWYPTISEASKQYIADAIYCNDRQVSSANSSYTGNGSWLSKTWYKTAERLATNSPPIPTLTCKSYQISESNNRFTLDSGNFSVKTNGMLDAPVGLITADEAALAGGRNGVSNSKYYLYIGFDSYWTMSPYSFDGYFAYAFVVTSGGLTSRGFNVGLVGVRPVISLKSDALKYDAGVSNGSMEHPFVLTD